MKRVLAVLLGLLGIAGTATAERYEASTGFDASQVRPFLELLNQELSLSIEVLPVTQFITETPLEQERTKSLTVKFKGTQVKLDIRVFMDDVESPDVYFLTENKELSEAINAWLHQYLEDTGV